MYMESIVEKLELTNVCSHETQLQVNKCSIDYLAEGHIC